MDASAGLISNIVSIIRNLVFWNVRSSGWLKLVFIALQAVLFISSLGATPVSWLPLINGVLSTWFVVTPKETVLKAVIIIAQFMWLPYDLYYLNFVSAVFDIFSLLSNTYGFIRLCRKTKKNAA